MPSCSSRYNNSCSLPEDCADWETDGDAWAYLEDCGFTQDRFLIHPPAQHSLTDKEVAAICFLIHEWDWCYDDSE